MKRTKDIRDRFQKGTSRVAPLAIDVWSLRILKVYVIALIDPVLEKLSVPVEQRRNLNTVRPERI